MPPSRDRMATMQKALPIVGPAYSAFIQLRTNYRVKNTHDVHDQVKAARPADIRYESDD